MDEKQLKELMLRRSEEFKKLSEEHRKLEEELKLLEAKPSLTEDEGLAVRELKKRKLAFKDRMYQMMSDFRKNL